MAKELVMELIQASQLLPGDMHNALQNTYRSLMDLKAREETGANTVERPPTSMDWRKSITQHAVTCLECGAVYRQLSVRHLRQHDLDGRSYREKYGIPRTQPLAMRATTARRREVAHKIKPWKKAQEVRADAAKKRAREKAVKVEE